MPDQLPVGIAGANGRMGQTLVRLIEESPDLKLSGAFDRDDDPLPVFEKSRCIIDFTMPQATLRHASHAAESKTALVIGTTGLSAEQEEHLKQAAQKTPVLYAANMSVGVNMLAALVEQAAARLGAKWDIEIAETHHRHKVDAPSGTALMLGRAAHKGRDGGAFVTDRNGARKEGDIGFAVQRGGDVIGEHAVSFYGAKERLTLGHIASDRSLFAEGALKAARWLAEQPPGLYDMQDMLGL